MLATPSGYITAGKDGMIRTYTDLSAPPTNTTPFQPTDSDQADGANVIRAMAFSKKSNPLRYLIVIVILILVCFC